MSKYIKPERKGQIIFIIAILLAIIIGLVWAELENSNQVQKWPAKVTEHPLANAHISWEQTYHGGAWNE